MKLLLNPWKVLIFSILFTCASLLLNGSLFNLYRLHRDQKILAEQIESAKFQIAELDRQMLKVKDPTFIERQALDNFDMANEKDLVFVFPD